MYLYQESTNEVLDHLRVNLEMLSVVRTDSNLIHQTIIYFCCKIFKTNKNVKFLYRGVAYSLVYFSCKILSKIIFPFYSKILFQIVPVLKSYLPKIS